MTNFNFQFMETFLRYKDSNGNTLDLNGSQIDTDLDERTEQNTNDITALQHYFDSISIKESASGALVSVADGSDGIPVKELVVNIEPIQEGTGDPSPENVRPISGRTVVNIWRDGTHDTSADPTISIQLGQTVYGGTVDVVTGAMNVNMAMVDLGTLSWRYLTEPQRFYVPLTEAYPTEKTQVANAVCSMYPFIYTWSQIQGDVSYNYQIAIADNAGVTNITVRDTRYTNIESFTSAVTGQQLVYELAKPITLQLTPEQLTTILGQNYIWADSGNMAVKYVADTKLYIDSKIAVTSENRETVKETIKEIEKSDVIEEKEVEDDDIDEEKENE